MDRSIQLFSIPFTSTSRFELLENLGDFLESQRKGKKTKVVVTPNPEQVVFSRGNKRFLSIIQHVDIVLPDGVGVVWASKILAVFGKSKSISKRIAGVDVVIKLLEIAAHQKLKVLVIGGWDYQNIDDHFSKNNIKWLRGYQNVRQPQSDEEKRVREIIEEYRPDVVFVAFGAPHQEFWIDEHLKLLNSAGVGVVMAVGGSFDYLLGKVRRAPKWLQLLGLEWLFRLVVEPWRWRRQFRLLQFISLTFQELFKKG